MISGGYDPGVSPPIKLNTFWHTDDIPAVLQMKTSFHGLIHQGN